MLAVGISCTLFLLFSKCGIASVCADAVRAMLQQTAVINRLNVLISFYLISSFIFSLSTDEPPTAIVNVPGSHIQLLSLS